MYGESDIYSWYKEEEGWLFYIMLVSIIVLKIQSMDEHDQEMI